MQSHPFSTQVVLYAGDGVVLGLVTLVGFATHGELTSAGFRLLTTFIPLVIAWALIGPWLGVFNSRNILAVHEIWRPVLAMFLAAPMAAWLRGVWLDAPIDPVFVSVIGAVSAAGLLIWRGIYLIVTRVARQPQERGSNG